MTCGDPAICSVVIAVHNEAENVGAVVAEAARVLPAAGRFELVFVDDGSTDGTAGRLHELAQHHPEIRVIRLDRRCAKSAALRVGIARARGAWIATMDGDGQNDPADLLPMLRALRDSPPPHAIVAGIRTRRLDTWSRRVSTRFANRFRQAVLKDNCPDTGCGLKAFPREGFLRLPAFEGMHRFFPALFQMYGHPLVCLPVTHRPRLQGRSKYTNVGRALVGIGDLLGVVWLRSRTHLPALVTED